MPDKHVTRTTIAALKGVSKRYGQVTAVDCMNLEIRRGEVATHRRMPSPTGMRGGRSSCFCKKPCADRVVIP